MRPMTKKEKAERDAYIEKSRNRLQKALKQSTKMDLLSLIRSVLDCPGHFYKPTIKNPPKASFKKHKDEIYGYGDHPIVACSQCVDRMRKALALEDGEEVPSSFQYEGWKTVE